MTVLVVLAAGCETAREYSFTYKVWDKGRRPICRPAPEPQLAVFVAPTNREVLAAYDALSEREEKVERRAYFVAANEGLIMARKPPGFAELALTNNLSSVPLVATTNAVTNTGNVARYPAGTDYGPGFELYRNGRSEGTHPLPVYFEESVGTAGRVALTPLAVLGDTLLVAGVVGTFGALLWLQAGAPPFGN